MNKPLILTGDANVPDLPMSDAQVNHMRRLLAWIRLEYMLDEDMQRGFLSGAAAAVQHGIATPEQAGDLLAERAAKIGHVPTYVRQAVKMLTDGGRMVAVGIAAGVLSVDDMVTRTYSLDHVSDAYAALARGEIRGRAVITMAA